MMQPGPFRAVRIARRCPARDFHNSFTVYPSTFSPFYVPGSELLVVATGAGGPVLPVCRIGIAFSNQACYPKYVFARIRISFECLLAAISSFLKLVFRAV
jgi:hypothetical protein